MKYWNKRFNIIRLVIFIQFLFVKVNCQNAILTINQNFSAYVGGSVNIVCNTQFMRPNDVVWSYKQGNVIVNYIYRDNAYQGSFPRFLVTNYDYSFTNVTTVLTIQNIFQTDALYTYQCSCNQFAGCINQPFNYADASLFILTTTTSTTTTTTTTSTTTTTTTSTTTTTTSTTTTSTTSTSTTSTSTTPTTTSTTTSTTTTTTTTPPPVSICLDGLYLTAQYVLVTLTLIILICTTVLFHFSFVGSLVETFFMVLSILLTIFCLIVGLIFWINPLLATNVNIAPVITVSVPLLGCIILWMLNLQYAIRLCLLNEIKTIVVIIICVDGLLESIAAGLIIAANLYCAGLSTFKPISGFNYAYLEIIGSIFLLVFGLILLLIAGIVFYMKKSKHDEHILNSFKALVTASPFNAATPFGFFSHPSSAASISNRPQVHELWFQHSSQNGSKKVFPINPYNLNQYEMPHSSLPVKPKKLTPLYSKKRSEINQITDAATNNRLPNIHNSSSSGSNKEETTIGAIGGSSSATATSTNSTSANKRIKKTTKSKMSKEKPTLVKTIENNKNEQQPIIITDQKLILEPEQEHNNNNNKTNFELIWNSENLMPKIEEDAQFETPNMKRTKSFLGGKVFKLEEENKIISLGIKAADKNNSIQPSMTKLGAGAGIDTKSDDSAILLLNSASSSSSII